MCCNYITAEAYLDTKIGGGIDSVYEKLLLELEPCSILVSVSVS